MSWNYRRIGCSVGSRTTTGVAGASSSAVGAGAAVATVRAGNKVEMAGTEAGKLVGMC